MMMLLSQILTGTWHQDWILTKHTSHQSFRAKDQAMKQAAQAMKILQVMGILQAIQVMMVVHQITEAGRVKSI
jgi:hypothetical protein